MVPDELSIAEKTQSPRDDAEDVPAKEKSVQKERARRRIFFHILTAGKEVGKLSGYDSENREHARHCEDGKHVRRREKRVGLYAECDVGV